MDGKLIEIGRSRIALNMIGFGLIYGFGTIIIYVIVGGPRQTGPRSNAEIGVFLLLGLLVLIGALYVFGRCLGGIVHGIAEIVRGVNANRPMPPRADLP